MVSRRWEKGNTINLLYSYINIYMYIYIYVLYVYIYICSPYKIFPHSQIYEFWAQGCIDASGYLGTFMVVSLGGCQALGWNLRVFRERGLGFRVYT